MTPQPKIRTLVIEDGRTDQQLRDAGFRFDRVVRRQRCEPCDVLHVTPRADWQHVTTRGRFALAGLGLTVSEEATPTPQRFAERVEHSKPRAVFVHAFCVKAERVIQAARRWPAVRFVVVSHSQENHVMQWPQFFGEIRDVLAAAATTPNLYYAGSDEAQHWQALGHRNVIRWHWPCVLTDQREPPAVEPETVLISSRADLVKALPSQVIAAGLLQRGRGCRVAMSLNHESTQRRDGTTALAQATGVRIDRWPWLSHEAFVELLRADVSIVLQPSLSETFNYVSWEAGSVGRPWVGSDAIKHTPAAWRADPNSPADIARVAVEILDDYEAASRRAWEIADAVGRRNNEAYRAGIERLLSGPAGRHQGQHGEPGQHQAQDHQPAPAAHAALTSFL